MKLTFLGVSGALSFKYNSNILIEQGQTCMLFDCGEDVMYSLKEAGRSPEELTDIYISHLHSDHCGGLSWLGYYSYFILKRRLTLHIHESMVSDIWSMLRPSMEKLNLTMGMMTLDGYFDVVVFKNNEPNVVKEIAFTPIEQLHVETSYGNMYSYGVVLQHSIFEEKQWKITDKDGNRKDNKRVFISSDSKKLSIPYTDLAVFGAKRNYDYIFCDCDVMNLNGVHPNYNDLKNFQDETKHNMWLYHYTDLNDYNEKYGKMPNALADGFAGFVKQGQIFEI